MSDLIRRQDAIDRIRKTGYADQIKENVIMILMCLPPAQPEIKPIEYRDCANAMLKMWMDNVVTDGEYNRIMDKLNAHWRKKNG